jgi:hypothetical protein
MVLTVPLDQIVAEDRLKEILEWGTLSLKSLENYTRPVLTQRSKRCARSCPVECWK